MPRITVTIRSPRLPDETLERRSDRGTACQSHISGNGRSVGKLAPDLLLPDTGAAAQAGRFTPTDATTKVSAFDRSRRTNLGHESQLFGQSLKRNRLGNDAKSEVTGIGG